MKKIAIISVIVFAALYLLLSLSGSFIKTAVEAFGPKILGVKVHVADVLFVPFLGKASVRGLKIENLPNYKEKYLFEVGSVSVSMNLRSLMKDTILINSISVNAPVVAWEGSLSESNVTKLQDKVAGAAPAQKKSASPKIFIEHLKIENAKAIVRLGGGEPMTLSLPPIILDKVSSEQKAEASSKIMAAVVGEISKQIVVELGKHPEVVGKAVGDTVGGLVNGVKGLFGK